MSQFLQVGKNIALGVANGIKNGISAAINAAKNLATNALNAAKAALGIHSPSKEFYKIGENTVEGFLKGIEDNEEKLTSAVNEMMKKSVELGTKFDVVLKFASGPIEAAAGLYQKAMAGDKAAEIQRIALLKKETTALEVFTKLLYEQSDKYEEDQKKLNEYTVSYRDNTKKLADLQKQLNSATGDAKTEIQNEIKSTQTAIEDAQKNISEMSDTIVDHIKETFETLRDNISSTLKKFGDPLSASITSGLSIFDEFNSNGADSKRAKAIAKAEKEEAEAKKTLKEATGELAEAEAKLAEAQAKSDAVLGRSQKFLDDIEEKEKKVAEAKKKVTEATEKEAETAKALEDANKDTSVDDLLKNMDSQINGYEQWRLKLEEVRLKGASSALMKYLTDLGVKGYDTVVTFSKMTSEQFKRAQDMFKKNSEVTSDTLLNDYKNKLQQVKEWQAELQELAAKGLNWNILQDLAEKGPDSLDYVTAILDMSNSEFKEFNNLYSDYQDSVSKTTDEILGDLAYTAKYGKDILAIYSGGFNKAIKTVGEKIRDLIKKEGKETNDTTSDELSESKGAAIGVKYLTGVIRGMKSQEAIAINEAKQLAKKIQNALETSPVDAPITGTAMSWSKVNTGVSSAASTANATIPTKAFNGSFINTHAISANQSNSSTTTAGTVETQWRRPATNSATFNNTFNITSNNAKEVAAEVSRIIQKDIKRKDAVWA